MRVVFLAEFRFQFLFLGFYFRLLLETGDSFGGVVGWSLVFGEGTHFGSSSDHVEVHLFLFAGDVDY